MKACLIGTGGVGSVGALALESGGKCQVTVVSRGVYSHVSKHGFDFESVDYGSVKGWFPSHIAGSVDEAAGLGPFDYVVVSTKNIPEVQRTEDLVRPLVAEHTAIVLVQNGIGGEEDLMKAFPNNVVIGGISMIGSASYGGKVKHTLHDHLIVGTYDKRPEAQKLTAAFHDAYAASKSTCEVVQNLKYRRWCKLVYNSAYNTTAALTGLDTGRLMFSDLRDNVVLPAMREVRKIAEAELNEKLPEDIEDMMLNSDDGTYFEPSMLVDVKKNQPIELEVILGNPLRTARRVGVEAPTLTLIYKLLHGKQFKLLENKGTLSVPSEPYDRSLEPVMPIHLKD